VLAGANERLQRRNDGGESGRDGDRAVRAFERAFAEYVGAPHAIALNSCTAALHLSLLASRIGRGDDVVTTPMTFCATANVITHVGARPRFADIDPSTWNLTAESAAAALTARTRAVLPVHYAGRAVDAAAFRALASRAGLVLIEDAAPAVEAVSAGAKIGATADLTCFSFYATKTLSPGDGGLLKPSAVEPAAFARTAPLPGITRAPWARYAPRGAPHADVVMPGPQ